MEEKDEFELFQFCTEDMNLEGDRLNSNKMSECFKKGYKFGYISKNLVNVDGCANIELHDGTYFIFKDKIFKDIYKSMCRDLKLNFKDYRLKSPLNDILINIFEGYCIYFLAINASQFFHYDQLIPKWLDLLENNHDQFYDQFHDDEQFIHTIKHKIFVQRMDLRRVFDNISTMCIMLYKKVKRKKPELFITKNATIPNVVIRNILLGMKFKSCGEKSPLKFLLDDDKTRAGYVKNLTVPPYVKVQKVRRKSGGISSPFLQSPAPNGSPDGNGGGPQAV